MAQGLVTQGIESGRAGAVNPFYEAINRVNELKKQKDDFNNQLELESVKLTNLFSQMGKEHEYKSKLEELKGQQSLIREKYKADTKAESAKTGIGQTLEAIQKAGGGGGGFAPGTTATFRLPGMNISTPLNREFTEAERISIAGGENVNRDVERAVSFVNSGVVDNLINQLSIDSSKPILATGEVESLQSVINNLKATIPFAKGGKTLSPTESKTLNVLLNTTGKRRETIIGDLMRFEKEFNRMRELSVGGQAVLGQNGGNQTSQPSSQT